MRATTFITAAVTAAFGLALAQPPLAHAQSGASAVGTGPTGGVPRTGGPNTPPSAGEPLDFTGHPIRGASADNRFSLVDIDRDGSISREEWNRYVRPGSEGRNYGSAGASGGASSAGGARDSSAESSFMRPLNPGTPTGVTAGPGTVSPRTAAGSATATTPDTSGFGRAQ